MANNPFDAPPHAPGGRPARGPTIDMTIEGDFPRTRVIAPGALKLGAIAVLVAVVAGALALAAVALWLAFLLIPVAVVAALIGWGAIKLQRWQSRGAKPVDIYRR
jgi:hypothetical protein